MDCRTHDCSCEVTYPDLNHSYSITEEKSRLSHLLIINCYFVGPDLIISSNAIILTTPSLSSTNTDPHNLHFIILQTNAIQVVCNLSESSSLYRMDSCISTHQRRGSMLKYFIELCQCLRYSNQSNFYTYIELRVTCYKKNSPYQFLKRSEIV